jgi:hypothetical protein
LLRATAALGRQVDRRYDAAGHSRASEMATMPEPVPRSTIRRRRRAFFQRQIDQHLGFRARDQHRRRHLEDAPRNSASPTR